MKIMSANRIAPDGMPRFLASHLGLFYLPMTHKKDARLIWVKKIIGASVDHYANMPIAQKYSPDVDLERFMHE